MMVRRINNGRKGAPFGAWGLLQLTQRNVAIILSRRQPGYFFGTTTFTSAS